MKLLKSIGLVLVVVLLSVNLVFSQQFDLIPGKSVDEIRILKLKVVADEGYQQYVINWQKEIAQLIQKASLAAGTQVGIKLEIIGFDNWQRKTGEYQKLEFLLTELVKSFPRPENADFDIVVGLTADSEKSHGAAVYRGYFFLNCKGVYRADEYRTRIHYWLTSFSRERIFPSVILHELGHIFGCDDRDEIGSVMFRWADDFSTTFCKEDIETIKKNKWRKFPPDPVFLKNQLEKY